jgi:hypothetical protein
MDGGPCGRGGNWESAGPVKAYRESSGRNRAGKIEQYHTSSHMRSSLAQLEVY